MKEKYFMHKLKSNRIKSTFCIERRQQRRLQFLPTRWRRINFNIGAFLCLINFNVQ